MDYVEYKLFKPKGYDERINRLADAVMKKYELQGMRLTQFVVPEKPEHPYRCKNITEKCWAMIGTHDNQPVNIWAKNMVNTHTGYLHVKNYLVPNIKFIVKEGKK